MPLPSRSGRVAFKLGRNSMNKLRVRILLPALLVQLIVALTSIQPALSQEVQTTLRPAQNIEASNGKAATQDKTCEESPTAATAAAVVPQRAGSEQSGAGEAAIFKSPPVRFMPSREVKVVSARPFVSGPEVESSSKSFNRSNLSHTEESANPQQTGATAATFTPLTSDQKMKRAFKSAFLSPRAFLLPGVGAIITEAGEDDLPHKDSGDRVADGLSRFAINFGTRSTSVLLGNGVYASLFKQDPRYYPSESKNIGVRALYAASRVFVRRGDNGKQQPNYSRFAGQLSASALSNLWQQSTPGHDRIGTDATFRRFGYSFASGAIVNVITEFLPDIKKIFGK